MAYDDSPSSSSCASKVPMQPRNDAFPDLEDTVFQVTNSGDSVMAGGSASEREDTDVSGVLVPRDILELEFEDGVDKPSSEEPATRSSAGRRFFRAASLDPSPFSMSGICHKDVGPGQRSGRLVTTGQMAVSKRSFSRVDNASVDGT